MPTVEISSRFFTQELNNYSCFITALFRELTQNAVDAGCSVISAQITQAADSKDAVIKFHDNGCGMTEEVLRNVYFRLGETTKLTGDTIGGFGKARILTCFAHPSYTIRTNTLLCTGSGGQYEIQTDQPHLKGCLLEIHVEAASRYGNRIDVRDAFEQFLGKCQLPCKVFVNDAQFTNWLYHRQVNRSLSFGNIHVNKSNATQSLYVRVNGVLMYTKYCRANAQVIVEIEPKNSRKVLLSNRDSLHRDYEVELDNFLAEVAANTKSALKPRFHSYKERLGSRYLIKRRKDVEQPVRFNKNEPHADAAYTNAPISGAHSGSETPTSGPTGATPSRADSGTPVLDKQALPSVHGDGGFVAQTTNRSRWDDIAENMLISVDSENEKVRKAISFYNPKNWKEGTGSNRKKLWILWTAACAAALEALIEMGKTDGSVNWQTGFVFSDDTEAQHVVDGNAHCLLLNPVDSDGKMKFRLNNWEDRVNLIAMAVHEVVHVKQDYHDEDFASLQTELTAKVFAKLSEINKDMNRMVAGEYLL